MEEEQRQQRREETVKKAELLVESSMRGRDASHDAAHAFRVRDLALSLACDEGLLDLGSLHVVEIAALLHDVGDYKYTKDSKEDTQIISNFLDGEGVEGSINERVLSIIRGMGFKNEVQHMSAVDSSLEFQVVQDADRLDAIGAIGIARCFTFGGSKNIVLHDPLLLPRVDLTKEKYMKKDEKQTTINHFHEKLLKLKDLMKTKAGRRKAERRHKFMEDFLTEFYEEWSCRA